MCWFQWIQQDLLVSGNQISILVYMQSYTEFTTHNYGQKLMNNVQAEKNGIRSYLRDAYCAVQQS